MRDVRYGRPLGGTIKTRYAHLGANDVGNADYDDLDRLFFGVVVGPTDVIVDVGCGKGRSINWFLERFPANRIVGIELAPDICAATAKRLRRHAKVTIACGDAAELLPPDGTIFYLFNPFDESVLRRFASVMLDRARDDRLPQHQARGGVRGQAAVHSQSDRPARAQLPLGAGDGAHKPVRLRRAGSHTSARRPRRRAPPHRRPSRWRSPSTTINASAISTPCAQSRSPGRPIVTGKVFVQLSTSWIAAATGSGGPPARPA